MNTFDEKEYIAAIVGFSVVVLFYAQFLCFGSPMEVVEKITTQRFDPFCIIAKSKPEPEEIKTKAISYPLSNSASLTASASLSTVGTSQLYGPSPSPSEFE